MGRAGEVGMCFLRIGLTTFGGPAAHIAVMEHELVRRRRWLSRRRFLDLHAVANLLPGPNSTELALSIGRARAGWPGLVAAGAGFVLPAVGLTLALAWIYARREALPGVGEGLRGVQAAAVAVIARAAWALGRTAVDSMPAAIVAAAVAAGVLLGAPELVVLAGAGAVTAMARRRPGPAAFAADPIGLTALFAAFLKIGSILYGSGYVLFAYLRTEFVAPGWLTNQAVLDAVAAGQMTPGPLFSSATFIGYLLGGTPGAIVATIGIFLPAFVFVMAGGFVARAAQRHPAVASFIRGVATASAVLLAVAGVTLARTACTGPGSVLIAVAALLALGPGRRSPALVIPAGGALGLLLPG